MYAIVDLETTGGYAENHRITEIAICLHDGIQVTQTYHRLVNPGRDIPYYITGLTGITNEMVSDAPYFSEIATEVFDLLQDKIFVAHNAHFDFSFLKREFELTGRLWNAKKLCTVRLSRKIIPGLRSYSLGSLADSLGIVIENRHRASGDVEATVKVFDALLQRDQEGHISKALKRNAGESILPPNLPREVFDRLPAKPGVYYFHNANGQVIYVGKAINIRKRIAGHFTGDAREWSRSKIRFEIHDITFQLTGNEMVALVVESQEIRRLWPRYNQAQKFRTEDWGIYHYEDQTGLLRFTVNQVVRASNPVVRFASKTEAWNFLWEKVRQFDLCPKLCGLQLAKGLCFHYQTGECKGACMGVEGVKKYNKRVHRAMKEFTHAVGTAAIIGRGRTAGEHSILLVEAGVYKGYGYFQADDSITDLESAKRFIKEVVTNQFIQNLVHACLANPRGYKVVELGE